MKAVISDDKIKYYKPNLFALLITFQGDDRKKRS